MDVLNTTTSRVEHMYSDFVTEHPSYKETNRLDELRTQEFCRINDNKHVYLDFVGSNLYPKSLLEQHYQFLNKNVYGNPHSENPTSCLATECNEQARAFVKEYFNDLNDEYSVVFTLNASGALKLVGESYKFQNDGCYLLTVDNHNSVNGIREFARAKGSAITYAPVAQDTLQIVEDNLSGLLSKDYSGNKLFAYPAQSNFSGVKHDLGWIEEAQGKGWDVLLDAAAYAPTNKLDLTKYKPDFVCVSFYKIFGYPTGIGCLLIKKTSEHKLNRPWFAGGTIEIATVSGDAHFYAAGSAKYEDGTINFLNIPAIEMGLRFIDSIGIEQIQNRTSCLTSWTLDRILELNHSNGKPLVSLYGTDDLNHRGATITFNLYDDQEELIFYRDVEAAASLQNISVRGGCFCNPGAFEAAHNIKKEAFHTAFDQMEEMTFGNLVGALKKEYVVGAVRVSFGYISTFEDAVAIVDFVRSYLK